MQRKRVEGDVKVYFYINYNVYDAYQHLLINKAFCDIKRLEEAKYYMLYVRNGQVEIEEINITLYELFMGIIENKGKSVNETWDLYVQTVVH